MGVGRFGSVAIALALTAGIASARPGGGESYSGGGGGGYSGGGGGYSGGGVGGYTAVGNHTMPGYDPGAPSDNRSSPLPWLATMFTCCFVGWLMLRRRHKKLEALEEAVFPNEALRQALLRPVERGPHPVAGPISLDGIQRIDPGFSSMVFEDFAFRLFSAAQRARHDSASVAPYVSPGARRALAKREPAGKAVKQVVVGALRSFRLELADSTNGVADAPNQLRIGVEFEANIATAAHTYFSVERWWFVRDLRARSKPPSAAYTFPCPNCGAPWQPHRTSTQTCESCERVVDNGRFDWHVEAIEVVALDERPPTLTHGTNEHSAELDTIKQDDVRARWQDFITGEPDPAVAEAMLMTRLKSIYRTLNHAWSNNDLKPARDVVSDGLYDYLQYWIDAYLQQGLRNELTDMRIERTEITRVQLDRYFDAITIRIFATGKDVTLRLTTGEPVVGSAERDRPYSEYWTLIRAAVQSSGDAAPVCSHCHAPLAAGHAGACDHCGSFVVSNRRDWILAKIEQADTFRRRGISSDA